MKFEEVKQRAKLPPPKDENHPGPPPGWVPPPPPAEMEPECEAVISGAVNVEGTQVNYNENEVSVKDFCGLCAEAVHDNESALYAHNGAKVTVNNAVLTKKDGALVREIKNENGEQVGMLPMLRGINSTVLVNGEGSEVTLKNTQLLSPCEPGDMALEAANGVFTVFKGKAYLENVNIEMNAGFGHGLYDSQFGVICAEKCNIVTTGHCGSAVATDQPGGDLYLKELNVLTKGPASAGIYVDGGSHAEAYDSVFRSEQDAGAALCNDGYLRIDNSTIRGTLAAKIWQPVENPGLMELQNDILISDSDSAFVFEGYGTVIMDHCTLEPAIGHCAIESRRCEHHYDHIGRGTAVLRNCTIMSDLAATDDCTLEVQLDNTLVEGRLYNVDLKVGYGSRVIFTGDSYLKSLEAEDLNALTAVKPCTITYHPVDGGIQGRIELSGGAVLVPEV